MIANNASSLACSLNLGDMQERLDWIADLNRAALLDSRRHELELELWYAPEAADRVREMVRREQGCCGFLAFELRQEADAVRLTIRAPERARDAADMLFGHFAARAKVEAGCGCR